jgi:hypothetical protein
LEARKLDAHLIRAGCKAGKLKSARVEEAVMRAVPLAVHTAFTPAAETKPPERSRSKPAKEPVGAWAVANRITVKNRATIFAVLARRAIAYDNSFV